MAVSLNNYTKEDLLNLDTICCVVQDNNGTSKKFIDKGSLRDFTTITQPSTIGTNGVYYPTTPTNLNNSSIYRLYAMRGVTYTTVNLALAFNKTLKEWISRLYSSGKPLYILYTQVVNGLVYTYNQENTYYTMHFSNIFQAGLKTRVPADSIVCYYLDQVIRTNTRQQNPPEIKIYTKSYGSTKPSENETIIMSTLVEFKYNYNMLSANSNLINYPSTSMKSIGYFSGSSVDSNTPFVVEASASNKSYISGFLISFKKPKEGYIEGFKLWNRPYSTKLGEIDYSAKSNLIRHVYNDDPLCFIFG